MTDQEFWDQAAIAALTASADDDLEPEDVAQRVAEIAECMVAVRNIRINQCKEAQ